jgi:hypothetical protein
MSAQGEIEITAGYKDKTQDGLIKTEKQVIKIGDAAADVKKISKDVVKQMLGWGGARSVQPCQKCLFRHSRYGNLSGAASNYNRQSGRSKEISPVDNGFRSEHTLSDSRTCRSGDPA